MDVVLFFDGFMVVGFRCEKSLMSFFKFKSDGGHAFWIEGELRAAESTREKQVNMEKMTPMKAV